MTGEKNTRSDFAAFQKEYAKIIKGIARERKNAVGILDPSMLTDSFLKQLEDAGQNLVLAYGRNGELRQYSLDMLKNFIAVKKKYAGKFKSKNAGVPLRSLERASSAEDFVRSKAVRSATLYKVDGGVLYFRVTATGTTPNVSHHQVRVRLEGWIDSMNGPAGFIVGAKNAATGRISFDCDCGRHQYWFRYLATIGGFALDPKEQGFPKIRNPQLDKGCCCKHVLKALGTLKNGAFHLLLAKEMERQAKAKGFAPSKGHILSEKDLRVAVGAGAGTRRKKVEDMLAALAVHKKAADRLKQEARPRGAGKTPKDTQMKKDMETFNAATTADRQVFVNAIRDVFDLAQKYGINADGMLDGLARGKGVARSAIDDIAKQEGLL